MSTPDLAGFADAQERLRQQYGVDATFIFPGDMTYAPDVQLNPRTGKPYDPFATPDTVTAEREEVVRCSVVTKALGGRAEAGRVTETPIGSMSDAGMALMFNLDDYARVDDAPLCEVYGETWKVTQLRRDELGDRGIAFLAHR